MLLNNITHFPLSPLKKISESADEGSVPILSESFNSFSLSSQSLGLYLLAVERFNFKVT